VLDDLKQFFATSSVAEVGVGVTVGAAFAAVVAAGGDAIRSLVAGEPSFGGLAVAAGTLLVVVLLSLFGVVKPLMRLKERLARVQTAHVAEAVAAAREGDLAGATDSARAAVGGAAGDDGAPAPGGDDVPAGDGPLPADGAAAGTTGPGPYDVVATADALPVAGEDASAGAVPQDDSAVQATPPADGPLAAAEGTAAPEPVAPWDPLTDPLPAGGAGAEAVGAAHGSPALPGAAAAAALASQSAGAGTDPVGAVPGAPAGDAAAAPRVLPFAATSALKACPFCAFEVPAVATRCGWCTSDLGAVERAVAPVPVEG
jgi:hypothetical protein